MCLHWADIQIDKFASARSVVSCENWSFSQSSKAFVHVRNFSFPATMQSDPNVLACLRYFEGSFALKDVFISSGPWSIAAKQGGNAAQRFPSYAFPFHPVFFFKKQFFCWLFPIQTCLPASKISEEVVYTGRLAHFWNEISDWYNPDIFFLCHFPIQILFYPDSYGIDIRFTSAQCKREAYIWIIPKTIGNRKRDCAWGGSGW